MIWNDRLFFKTAYQKDAEVCTGAISRVIHVYCHLFTEESLGFYHTGLSVNLNPETDTDILNIKYFEMQTVSLHYTALPWFVGSPSKAV